MKHTVALAIASSLSILFTTLHLTHDIVLGMSPGGIVNLAVVLVLVVWLYATVVLVERRSGHIIILVASLMGAGLPIVHMTGTGGITGGARALAGGTFFFAWTLLALGVTAILSVLLSVRGLRSPNRLGSQKTE